MTSSILFLCSISVANADLYRNADKLPKDPYERFIIFLNYRHYNPEFDREMIKLAPNYVSTMRSMLADERTPLLPLSRVMSLVHELGDKRYEFVPLLKDRLRDSNWAIRCAAIGSLKHFKDPEFAASILPLIDDLNWSTSCAAGIAMTEIGTAKELKAMRQWIEEQKNRKEPHRALPEMTKYANELEKRLMRDPKR